MVKCLSANAKDPGSIPFNGTEHGIPGPERGQGVESREGEGWGTGGREGARGQSVEWWADLFS